MPPSLSGRYRVIEPLGHGGMGQVWLARDEILERDVAIKEIDLIDGAGTETLHRRTLREARAAARLSHPNVVQIFDILEADGRARIIMEYVPSRSLQQVLRDDGPLSPRAAAQIGLSLLAALRAAHRAGVDHRDVKPGNVLLAHDGRILLTDFGIATIEGDNQNTSGDLVIGSPEFMSPERARYGSAGLASDLWSLGATLYAAVEGRSPFHRGSALATLTALASEEPDPHRRAGVLGPALDGLLRRDPSRRIGVSEAEHLLRAAATGAYGRASLPPPRPREAPDEAPAAAPSSPSRETPTAAHSPDESSASAGLGAEVAGLGAGAAGVGAASPAEVDAGTNSAEVDAGASSAEVGLGTSSAEVGPGTSPAEVGPGASPAQVGPATSAADADSGTRSPEDHAGTDPEKVGAGSSAGVAGSGASPVDARAGASSAEVGPSANPAVAGSGVTPAETGDGARVVAAEPDDDRPGLADGGVAAPPRDRGAAPPADDEAAPGSPRSRNRLIAIAAVVLVVLIAAATWLVTGRDAGGTGQQAAPTADPTGAAATATAAPSAGSGPGADGSGPGAGPGAGPNASSAAPAPSAATTPAAAGDGGGGELPPLPSGWTNYRDRTGFSLYVPAGWTRSREGRMVYFRGDGRVLGIDQTDKPQWNPVADWKGKAEYRVGRGDFPGYREVHIKSVDYWIRAADWEFTFTRGGVRQHVNNRGFIVANDQAYGMWWQTSDNAWAGARDDLQLIFDSFRPAR